MQSNENFAALPPELMKVMAAVLLAVGSHENASISPHHGLQQAPNNRRPQVLTGLKLFCDVFSHPQPTDIAVAVPRDTLGHPGLDGLYGLPATMTRISLDVVYVSVPRRRIWGRFFSGTFVPGSVRGLRGPKNAHQG